MASSPLLAATAPAKPTRSATAAKPATDPTPTTRLWNALLKQCGDSRFYVGSVFDASGMLSDVQVGRTKLIEYKGVKFASVPIRITDAERANGLQARSRITMRAHLYRTDGEQWQDGPDLRPRNMDDIIGRALGSANADMFGMGSNGAIALEVLKFKGRWYARRSSVDMSGPIIGSNDIFDVEKWIALPRPTYDCATHSVVAPKAAAGVDKAASDSSDDNTNQ